MADAIDILLSNPYLGQFLMSVSSSFGKKVAEKISESVISSLKKRFESNKTLPKAKIKRAEDFLFSLAEKEDTQGFLAQAFWMEFLTFMFPERTVKVDKLTTTDCEYMATRTWAALELESLLIDINYKPQAISYMAKLRGRSSRLEYFFDVKASYEQEYFDNFLITRVIDNRVCIPSEYIKSLPMLVQDINGDVSASPALLRDHDLFFIIQTGEIENSGKIRQIIKTVQGSYDVFLPRIIYLTEDDLNRFLEIGRTKAKAFLLSRIKETRPFRG